MRFISSLHLNLKFEYNNSQVSHYRNDVIMITHKLVIGTTCADRLKAETELSELSELSELLPKAKHLMNSVA